MTGVVLFGGVGGERLVGTGTTPTPEPACESSAVKKRINNKSVPVIRHDDNIYNLS